MGSGNLAQEMLLLQLILVMTGMLPRLNAGVQGWLQGSGGLGLRMQVAE